MSRNNEANHSAPRTPSKSLSLPNSSSDRRAASLSPVSAKLPVTSPAAAIATVLRRQYSAEACEHKFSSPHSAKAHAALYTEAVSDGSTAAARERRSPASCSSEIKRPCARGVGAVVIGVGGERVGDKVQGFDSYLKKYHAACTHQATSQTTTTTRQQQQRHAPEKLGTKKKYVSSPLK